MAAQLGPLSFVTSHLAGYTSYALANNPEDTKVRAAIKVVAITAANGLHRLAMLVEKVVRFLIKAVLYIVSTRTFQNVKQFTLEKGAIAKDFVVEKASQFRTAISTLQQPPKEV